MMAEEDGFLNRMSHQNDCHTSTLSDLIEFQLQFDFG
jgi:hypothetical protein